MGPMGPRGLGPNPFSTVSACPPVFFFVGNKRGLKQIMRIYQANDVCLYIFIYIYIA